jgi:type I restriction enzyme M protein
LIDSIAESLIKIFENAPLLDCYNIYQHLMDYWNKKMQDDCYLIAAEGWKNSAQPILIIEEKGKKNKVLPDLILEKKKYVAELIPPNLIVARYFAKEESELNELKYKLSELVHQLENEAEEQGVEGGLLEDAKNDKDKLTKTSITARLKEIKNDKDADEEREALQNYLKLIDLEADLSAKTKAAQEQQITRVISKYGQLTEVEIKTLVVEDKWIANLAIEVQDELGRVSKNLTGRILDLAARYVLPLPSIENEVEEYSKLVDDHFKKMVLAWK